MKFFHRVQNMDNDLFLFKLKVSAPALVLCCEATFHKKNVDNF